MTVRLAFAPQLDHPSPFELACTVANDALAVTGVPRKERLARVRLELAVPSRSEGEKDRPSMAVETADDGVVLARIIEPVGEPSTERVPGLLHGFLGLRHPRTRQGRSKSFSGRRCLRPGELRC
jgi:hypothetical protein